MKGKYSGEKFDSVRQGLGLSLHSPIFLITGSLGQFAHLSFNFGSLKLMTWQSGPKVWNAAFEGFENTTSRKTNTH